MVASDGWRQPSPPDGVTVIIIIAHWVTGWTSLHSCYARWKTYRTCYSARFSLSLFLKKSTRIWFSLNGGKSVQQQSFPLCGRLGLNGTSQGVTAAAQPLHYHGYLQILAMFRSWSYPDPRYFQCPCLILLPVNMNCINSEFCQTPSLVMMGE